MKRSYGELMRMGLLIVLINVVLMLVKITAGWLGNSYALVADGMESAGDIFSSLITWVGFQASLRPADGRHPYGHGKIESLAGAFAGVSLLATAIIIGYHAIQEIRTPHQAPEWFTLPVLLLVVVVKEVLARRVLGVVDGLDSQALRGDAWHHRADAVTSGAAALGIGIALIAGPGYESADDWAALLACGFIFLNGVTISRQALHELMDGSVDEALEVAVLARAQAVRGVKRIERCRIRKSGISLYVELHVQVIPTISILDGHDIAHRVEDDLRQWEQRIIEVLVHIEPASEAL
jgi:cation diffusion facilitator family transporter